MTAGSTEAQTEEQPLAPTVDSSLDAETQTEEQQFEATVDSWGEAAPQEATQPTKKRCAVSRADDERAVDGETVDAVRAVVKWACCSSRMVDIKQGYLLQKNPSSTVQDYDIMVNFLACASLAREKESGKGGGRGGLVLLRPASVEDLNHVVVAFQTWFGCEET